jgi:hypothetical protein
MEDDEVVDHRRGGRRNEARPNRTENVRRVKFTRRVNPLLPGEAGKDFSE